MEINLQKKFETKDVSNSKIKIDITPSINVHGDFKEVNGKDAIINAVRNLLMCPKGTYPFDPEYGCNIHKRVFENYSKQLEQAILYDLRECIMTYITEAKITYLELEKTSEKSVCVHLYLKILEEKNETELSLNIKDAADNMFETDEDIYSDTNSIG